MHSFKNLPVTAVKLLEKYILAGIGGDVAVFNLEQSIQLQKLNVLGSRTVHGLLTNLELSLLCTFGGKLVAVLQVDSKNTNLELKIVRRWHASDWILSAHWLQEANLLALLSAHNVVSIWDPIAGSMLREVACAENCILYSGTMLGRGMEDLVMIAGTVFQQVIIWTANNRQGLTSDNNLPVIHKLHGHKGVIFSVSYDSRSHIITSTSDDRTVRVWAIYTVNNRLDTADDWRAASITLLYTMFGHIARVWQSYILEGRMILSIGEDSQLCLWQDDGTSVYKIQTHQNAGIWCMDVDEKRGIVVTGGVDGAINLWPLHPPEVAPRSLPHPSSTPRRIALLCGPRVLASTDSGSLMRHEGDNWSTVFQDSRFSSYCLLEHSPARQHVGLASINGHIIVLEGADFKKVVDIQVDEGRIFSLHWLNEHILMSCHNHGNIYLWKFTTSGLEKVGMVCLPACKERWTTAAFLLGDTVVYGDRAGNIHTSPFRQSIEDKSLPQMDAVNTVSKAHNRLGVCSLTVLDGYVWSTGRDRTVNRYAVCADSHTLSLVSSSRLPFDWLADTIPSTPFGPAILCFHETKVVLWSVQERKELVSVPCGGGHRSWSCLLEDNTFYFTYLKDKTAHLFECPLLQISRPAIWDGFHGKEINSMAWISGGWIVSGGEDGSVRLSNYSNESWSTPCVEQNHLSSVRSVHVNTLDDRLLVFSAGGRAEMLVWQITLEPQASLMKLTSIMLREECHGRYWLNATPHSEPETRFMDVHTFPLSDTVLCVLVACSDAFLRLFHFNKITNRVSACDVKKWCDHCLLRVTSLIVQNNRVGVTSGTDGRLRFWDLEEADTLPLAGSKQLHQSGVNGLSICSKGLPQGHVLVATGGDDNTVSLYCFQVKRNSVGDLVVEGRASWSSPSYHSSVITGVEIVGDYIVFCGGDQRVTLLSWSLSPDDTLHVQCLTQCCCSVPDLKGLTILPCKKNYLLVCVYGVGLEIVKLDQMNNEDAMGKTDYIKL